jgi:REP element-mobilizing transposase RayT
MCAGVFRGQRRLFADSPDEQDAHTGCMTTARMHMVDPRVPGAYHVVSRCVRQAWLFGDGTDANGDRSHRKQWIEERIHQLAEQFAIGVYAYAVMDNHVHLVVQTDPHSTAEWSAEDIVRRWAAVCLRRFASAVELDRWVEFQLGNPSKVEEYRLRLGSLSWFMRLLNEPIARRANAEDACKGHFWEGRFRCQALLDEAAVLSAMAYVDLNPVRAGLVIAPESARHVSIRRRCRNSKRHRKAPMPLRPIAGTGPDRAVSERDYLKLVDLTGRRLHTDKRGAVPRSLPPIIQRLGLADDSWLAQVRSTESRYWRVIGCLESFVDKAAELGQQWLKGCGFAKRLDPHRIGDGGESQ